MHLGAEPIHFDFVNPADAEGWLVPLARMTGLDEPTPCIRRPWCCRANIKFAGACHAHWHLGPWAARAALGYPLSPLPLRSRDISVQIRGQCLFKRWQRAVETPRGAAWFASQVPPAELPCGLGLVARDRQHLQLCREPRHWSGGRSCRFSACSPASEGYHKAPGRFWDLAPRLASIEPPQFWSICAQQGNLSRQPGKLRAQGPSRRSFIGIGNSQQEQCDEDQRSQHLPGEDDRSEQGGKDGSRQNWCRWHRRDVGD